jgi:dolichol-phosphate mannosyltransferase
VTGRVFVLLPAYNESSALGVLIPDLGKELRPRFDLQIVVVDDGSRDETAAVCQRLQNDWPVQLLRHPQNQGYGAAIRTGMFGILAKARETDVVVTLDADNTHLPTYIPAMIQKLEEGFDVVTASYRLPGGEMKGVPWNRRLMSDVVNALFRWRVPRNHTLCFTNGFRAYRAAALQKARQRFGDSLIQATGFPGGLELFLNVLAAGARDGEVPFTLHYENRGKQSKIRILPTILAYLHLLKMV